MNSSKLKAIRNSVCYHSELAFQNKVAIILGEYYKIRGLTYENPNPAGGDDKNDGWVKEIQQEIIDNFLFSIFSGKLVIKIQGKTITKDNLPTYINLAGSKDSKAFYEVISRTSSDKDATLVEISRDVKKPAGTLKLKLLYAPDLNKKILVVRESGMKIAKIPSLPKHISFSGFFERRISGVPQHLLSSLQQLYLYLRKCGSGGATDISGPGISLEV